MLNKLWYKLGWPGLLIFLRRINKEISKMESRAGILAKYLLKVILLDKSFVTKRPSIIAAVVDCLAYYILGIGK
jgi:hypothetical protein